MTNQNKTQQVMTSLTTESCFFFFLLVQYLTVFPTGRVLIAFFLEKLTQMKFKEEFLPAIAQGWMKKCVGMCVSREPLLPIGASE